MTERTTERTVVTEISGIPYPGGVLPANRTLIMGVVNVTPDSFSDGGKYFASDAAIAHGLKLLDDGADILDIGGESTRPGAEALLEAEELHRVLPVIKAIRTARPEAVISIDTYKAAVARAALDAGARMVNDISGFGFDPAMPAVVHAAGVPVVLMHIKGAPRNMQENPHYDHLMDELIRYFQERIARAVSAGIPANQIILDPGIGFGKRLGDNYEILDRLEEITALGYPVLVGPSRKSFIGKTLNRPPEERVWGTAAAVAIEVYKGAQIVRVHDVQEMSQVVRIAERIRHAGTNNLCS